MIDQQLRARGIRDALVLEAVNRIPREIFVPPALVGAAYEDRALPIEAGQTISQPYMVAYMTEQLATNRNSRVLEVGTGSGYQTAILASLADHVYSIERIAELRRAAEDRLRALGLTNVTLHTGDGTLGLWEFAPYDRILVTAAAPGIPESLIDQLAVGGRLIIPVGGETEQTILRVDRLHDRTVELPLLACRFVKLIGEEGWRADSESLS